MMTTLAALLGALPLALENGTGCELRRPLGIAIVGGLLLSQFLTLYTTPVIYLYLDRFGRWFEEWRSRGHLGKRSSRSARNEPEPAFAGAMAKSPTFDERVESTDAWRTRKAWLARRSHSRHVDPRTHSCIRPLVPS